MEEITITLSGNYNLAICGEIIQASRTKRNKRWKVRFSNDESDKTISLPSSSFEDKKCTLIIRINNTEISPTFWSIDAVESEKDTFIITTYPNSMDLLTR